MSLWRSKNNSSCRRLRRKFCDAALRARTRSPTPPNAQRRAPKPMSTHRSATVGPTSLRRAGWVFTRSPDFFGTSEGATKAQSQG